MTYAKENQETIRQRDTRRSHQRDGEAESGDVCSKTASHYSEMTLDPQLARDEDRRLLAEYESCHTEKLAVAEQLINPRQAAGGALESIRLKCKDKWLAVRAHRKKMQDEGIKDDRSQNYESKD
jgi:hypothetical protein